MKKTDQPEDWSVIDQMIENQVRNSHHVAPSVDFTAKVLDKIAIAQPPSVSVYQPLISKNGWFVMIVLVGALVLLSFNTDSTGNATWFTAMNHFFSTISLPDISFFHNKVFVNSVAIGCVLLLFQFYILSKKYQIKN
ncbi:MAG: hypothetical protein RQ735_01960 [Flavobacteriaceae bacterium]|nr:hypothetical protein [Flavobacteriaceae bacterium]